MKNLFNILFVCISAIIYSGCNTKKQEQVIQRDYWEETVLNPLQNLNEFKGRTILQKNKGKYNILGGNKYHYEITISDSVKPFDVRIYEMVYNKYNVGDTIK